MKYLLITLLATLLIHSRELTPIATLKASGIVSDIVEDKGYLYVATDSGVVDVIDLTTQKITKQIHFDPIVRSDDLITQTRIHSIDRFGGKTLMVTSAANAYRHVWVEQNGTLTKVIDAKKHKMPKCAFFDKEGKIVLGTFGSDIMRYDTAESFSLYERHISESTMGGMALNKKREKMAISDESGRVQLIEINSSKVVQEFDSQHVDNIYRVAYRGNIIITAGQDRRVGVYIGKERAYHIKSDFLVYSVALSPSGEKALYSSGTEHHLQLFNPATGMKGDKLVGHQATPNKILFITEKAIISAGDEETVYFWMLP
ncbi:WD40 repeat domain-containing protein [Sulfurovum sp. ST-21]|uniref:Nitrate reductase n=1 Tax=Sulfurovum indicum TaxID=2779528 RepID=A0A7M1S5X0_9BACT|nr:nitrate reductase [Sulfurovum indicum]QOR62825.1 nitrate reductase [Sulfurovum indicum]